MRWRRSVSVAAAAWLAAGAALAADKPVVGPAPAWVRPAAPPAAPPAASEAAIRFLLFDEQLDLSPEAIETYAHTLVRIQTPQGLGALANLTFSWKPETDLLTLHRVVLHRGKERIDLLGKGERLTILRRENNLEYAMLDGVLTAVLQPEGARVGDLIEIETTLRRVEPALKGIADTIAGPLPNVPIDRVRLTARWPGAMPVRWRAGAGLAGLRESRQGGMTTLSLAADDVATVPLPTGAPSRYRRGRLVELSGFASWPQLSAFEAPLYAKAATLRPGSPLFAEIARIKAATPDPAARMMAALKLVQDDVRYLLLGLGDGNLVPAAADDTWARRFGDCKAKTALLLALLGPLGVPAEAVVVSSRDGDGLDQRLPRLGAFDHVLVRARIGDKSYWLDGTRLGDTALARLDVPRFRWALPLATAGAELVRLEPVAPARPEMERMIAIDASAGLAAPAPFTVTTVFRGDGALGLRMMLANLAPADRDRALRDYWRQEHDFVDIDSVAATWDEASGEHRLTMAGKARMAWKDGWYEADGVALGYRPAFDRAPGPDRDAPFAVDYPDWARTVETIRLPVGGKGFSVSGADVDRTLVGVAYRRKARIENGVFTVEASARAVGPEVAYAEALADRQALRDLATSAVHVRKPQAQAASPSSATFIDPAAAKARYDKATALFAAGDRKAAIVELDALVASAPKAAPLLALRAIWLIQVGDTARAQRDLDSAAAIDARTPAIFAARGMLAAREARWPAAIAAFTTALAFNPSEVFFLHQRAQVYMATNDLPSALADADEIIRLQPANAEAHLLRANIQRRRGDRTKALAEAEALLALPPTAQTLITAAAIKKSYGEEAEALRLADRAVAIAPAEFSYLARVDIRPSDDVGGRRADIEAALKLNPRSEAAQAMMMMLAVRERDWPAALGAADASIALGAADARTYNLRGIVLTKLGRAEPAAEDFRRARALAKDAAALNLLCWEKAINDVALATALDECRNALTLIPEGAGTMDSYALVLLRMKRVADARAMYDRALALAPTLATSLYGRGIARIRLGDKAGGETDLAAARKSSPTIDKTFAGYGVTP